MLKQFTLDILYKSSSSLQDFFVVINHAYKRSRLERIWLKSSIGRTAQRKSFCHTRWMNKMGMAGGGGGGGRGGEGARSTGQMNTTVTQIHMLIIRIIPTAKAEIVRCLIKHTIQFSASE